MPDNHSRKTVFRFNLGAGLTSLDPAFASRQPNIWASAQIFNTLLELDDSLRMLPSLARRYTLSPDGKTYTFFLRDSVRFHEHIFPDGKKFLPRFLTAQDFVYSFTRICDAKTASPGQWIFNGKIAGLKDFQTGNSTAVSGFRAVNDSTFQIELLRPFGPFLSLLAMPYAAVVPKEVVEYYGKDFRLHPVGTGPFLFKFWTEGRQLVLHKNPDYFEKGLPHIDVLAGKFISSRLTAYLEMKNGNLDFTEGIDPLMASELLDSSGKVLPGLPFQVNILPQLTTEYWGVNLRKGLLAKNVHLRRALFYALPRRELTRYLLKNLARPAEGFIPEGIAGYDPNFISEPVFNPQKAKEELVKAGFPDGKGLPEFTLLTVGTHAKAAELLCNRIALLTGIRIKIETAESAAIAELVSKGQAELWRASWIADYPDRENFLSLFMTENKSPAGPNTTHFSDPDFDRLIGGALTRPEPDSFYRAAEQIIYDRVPVIPIYYYRTVRLSASRFDRVPSCPMPTVFRLKRVRGRN